MGNYQKSENLKKVQLKKFDKHRFRIGKMIENYSKAVYSKIKRLFPPDALHKAIRLYISLKHLNSTDFVSIKTSQKAIHTTFAS